LLDVSSAVLSGWRESRIIGDNLELGSSVIRLRCSLEKRLFELKQNIERGSAREVSTVTSISPFVWRGWNPSHRF